MGLTKNEWADRTWSPVTGCTKISPGCKGCYAERMAKRLAGRAGYPKDKPFSVTLHPERLDEPLKWQKPSRIFVCSMGDLFHENINIRGNEIRKIFRTMLACQDIGHTFMILTKRPERMKMAIDNLYEDDWSEIANHIWLGVTAENQEMADKRIPVLLQIPAAVRFVSVEPMLGPVDILKWIPGPWPMDEPMGVGPFLDLVITGGETGPGARPAHPDWFRSLRDQCQAAGVPFFFKGWGEWYPNWIEMPNPNVDYHKKHILLQGNPDLTMVRAGRKAAGRLLDGREWNEIPGCRS